MAATAYITGDEGDREAIAKLLTEPLKTCPYCASDIDVWPGSGRKHIHIQCGNKKCPVRPHIEDYAPRAITGWNRRDG